MNITEDSKKVLPKLTKLITTVGPSSENYENLKGLFRVGSTCVRLNFSHGDFNEHLNRVIATRKIIEEIKQPISLMLDTKGPEIRTGDFEGGKVQVEQNSEIIIDCFNKILGNNKKFYIDYGHLIKDVKEGSIILLDDGKLQLQVTKISEKDKLIYVRAINTHIIKNHRGVNLPGTVLSLPFLSEKDKEDIKFACDNNLDFIALSFVRTKDDIKAVREYIKDFPNSQKIKLISKIESQQAIDNFDEILKESDMIMIARGDLGIEVPYENVPIHQEMIISKCIKIGKPCIVATQMLDSMTKNPHPTRAEVTDVYFAVKLGASSTMLSGESANGDYPILATFTMANIDITAEQALFKDCDYTELAKFASTGIKKIIKEVQNKKLNTLIALNPDYEDITRIASLHMPLQIVVLTDNKDLSTKFGIHFGTKAIYLEQLPKSLTKNNIKEILANAPDVNRSFDKFAILEAKYQLKPVK